MLWRSILLVILIAIPTVLRAQEAEILWDSWDVPHIYASNDACAFYGVGWAQAESYGHAILVAYVQTRGEASRYLGDDPAQVDSDRRVRVLNVAAVAQEWERRQTPAFAKDLAAFVTGINDYFLRYPERIPDGLDSLLPVRVSDVLGNVYRTWFLSSGWEGQALSWALAHGWNTQSGPQPIPNSSNMQSGSNAMAISGSKSRSGRTLLLINPHVNFSERWFEANIVTPHMNFTGATIPGFPAMLCGFNDYLGWAITISIAITFETIGRCNPLAATTFCLLTSAFNIPITYMLIVDGWGYGKQGVAGGFAADASLGVIASVLLGALLIWYTLRPPTAPIAETGTS